MEQLVSRYAIGIYRGYALTHYKPSTGVYVVTRSTRNAVVVRCCTCPDTPEHLISPTQILRSRDPEILRS